MQGETLAAIDMGSNSFRLELARVEAGQYHRLEYIKRVVRLGAGLDEQSRLTEVAMQRGLDCLSEFAQRLQGFLPRHVRAVATQTLREAANRDEFLARAQKALGFPIEIISGREEARLIYSGVSFLQPELSQTRLVIDIGGRSTELILGQGPQVHAAESFPVGSVGLSMRYFADGRLTREAFASAQVAAAAEFEEALDTFSPPRWQQALGSSGTVGAVSDILRASGLSDGRITRAGLDELMERSCRAGSVAALEMAGLKADRRAVMPGGLSILQALLQQFGVTELHPTKGALRQGVIIDLNGRLAVNPRTDVGAHVLADPRSNTVAGLQLRFAVDLSQARRVATQALQLWDGLGLDDAQASQELAWAAALHELGMALSHHDHHRHSAYMLAHVDAAGFSQSQQRRLSSLVLGQRGGLRKMEAAFAADPLLQWQVLCLRLAVIRCHARQASGGPDLRVHKRSADALRLKWQGGVPNERTKYLLAEESKLWARQGGIRLSVDEA